MSACAKLRRPPRAAQTWLQSLERKRHTLPPTRLVQRVPYKTAYAKRQQGD